MIRLSPASTLYCGSCCSSLLFVVSFLLYSSTFIAMMSALAITVSRVPQLFQPQQTTGLRSVTTLAAKRSSTSRRSYPRKSNSTPLSPRRYYNKNNNYRRSYSSQPSWDEENASISGTTTAEVTRTGVRAFLEGQPPKPTTRTGTQETHDRISTSTASSTYAQSLLRSAVYRLRVEDLRHELKRRGLDWTGTKKELLPRLLNDVPSKRQHRQQQQQRPSQGGSGRSPGASEDVAAPTKTPPPKSHLQLRNVPTSNHRPSHSPPSLRADPDRIYILQVKGLSSLSSDGTGIGLVLFDPSNEAECWEARHYLHGNRSVFEAEYTALVVAIQYVTTTFGVRKLVVETDHDVIQKQLVGIFNVKRDNLRKMYWIIMQLKEEILEEFHIHPISEHDNERACELARKALATGKSINVVDAFDPMDILNLSSSQPITSAVKGAEPDDRDSVVPNDTSTPLPDPTAAEQVGHDIIDPSATYRLQFDGGARGNPKGIAGAGMVLYDPSGNEMWCGWKYLDRMSNNAAEYCALLLGLRCARSLGIRSLMVEGDSELIIKQLTGRYQVRDTKLQKLYGPTKEAMNAFDNIQLQHVFRKDNKRADWLANHAMDTRTSHGFDEVDDTVTSFQ